MSIKKSLLALVAAAMATMAFASPAMAVTADGVLRDVEGTAAIKENTVLHLVGWTKFETKSGATLECHETWKLKATGTTGTTGDVEAFTVPDLTKCKSSLGCTLKSHEAKNLPWHYTVTDNGRIDVTGNATTGAPIEIHNTYSGCLIKTTLLTLKEVQITPLATGERDITGGTGEKKLGNTAVLNEAIAGFEVDGFTANGEVHVENSFGGKTTDGLTALTGEFELTKEENSIKQRCTYEISAT